MKQTNSFTSSTSSFTSSTLSIPSSLAQSTNPGSGESLFEELVSKLFCCRILLVSTESAQQFTNNYFDGIGLVDIFNQLSQLSNLNSIIRDLNGNNAYAFKKIRYRFFDIEQFKVRMNENQVKKSQLEIVSSMQETCNLSENNLTTPWYSAWRNDYIDNYEKSDHDFIGSSCGCFFVITKDELPHYKVIFERLCASVKQMSNLNFLQFDFFRYFIVLSDEDLTLETAHGKIFQALNADFPNSFVLTIDPEVVIAIVEEQKKSSHAMFSIGDDEMPTSLSRSGTTLSDPLSEIQNQNSSFYNQLVSQRAQQQQCQLAKSSNSEKNDDTIPGNEAQTNSNTKKKFDENLLFSICQALSDKVDQLLRDFTNKSLIYWAERQIKSLGETISQRKGIRKSLFNATKSILNISSASLSKAITGTGSGTQSGVYYVPDAQEMQQRKLADLCMMLGLYEMALSLYYSARKDFQSENAWIYFAGASEMYAIASYFMNKFNSNYLDQAITTYLEQCKNIKLATRIVILAAELNCQLGRYNEAANMFIRLTGDDSDLRSALFLEQASKCFLLASRSQELLQIPPNEWIDIALTKDKESCVFHGSKFRKAAFHYILAGHRYNRCGLKHFALACYEKFSYPSWEAASDHVNLTVSRLSIMLPTQANENFTTHYLKGLEIYRANSHKYIFFNELMKEFKKIYSGDAKVDEESLMKFDMHHLNIPSVVDLFIISNDSLKSDESFVKGKILPKICYVGETLEFVFQLRNAFPITLTNVKLLCNQQDFLTSTVDSIVFQESNSCENVILKITPQSETEFELLGFEFKIDNIDFRSNFNVEKFKKYFFFKAIKSLPLIPVEINFPQFGLTQDALRKASSTVELRQNLLHVPISVYASEEFNFEIHCNLSRCNGWCPNTIKLFSDVRSCYSWPEIDNNLIDAHEDLYCEDLSLDPNDQKEYLVDAVLDKGPFMFRVHVPPKVSKHIVTFRLIYSDSDNEQREIIRKLLFDVRSCLAVEMHLDQVITVKNLFEDRSLNFFDVSIGDNEQNSDSYSVSVPTNQLAHLLLSKNSMRWSTFDDSLSTQRNGLVAFG